MWLDWSSGVLVTNAGHSNKAIVDAIVKQAKHHLLHNYCFPSALRAKLAKRLVEIAPAKLEKAFLLTTGAETTECAIKLMRTYGQKVGGKKKIGIVSYDRGFHGRTLGSQQIGGSPALKEWIVNLDPCIWQVPFPDGYWVEDTSFDFFLANLKKQGITPDRVAGVILETYQGGGSSFAPKEYMQKLAKWCAQHDIVLTCDEVQAGFGRTGKLFGFEHYGIVPDLACFGKGISSSLPVSAIIGRRDLMDLYPPGSMTSTHTGSPICVAAALASIDFIMKNKLWKNADAMGKVMLKGLLNLQKKYPERIGSVQGRGMVYAMHMVKAGGKKVADYDLAFEVIRRCIEKGLLFFSPVGACSIKIAPPLVVNREQVKEGLKVLDEAIAEALAEGA
jgi:4-aminobutyrate aminotransferase/diaminobutyrate-pyruvate transaminase/4-aminobutyrate aminotransferase/(S)-3-amino-2-methylpropionate transaminase